MNNHLIDKKCEKSAFIKSGQMIWIRRGNEWGFDIRMHDLQIARVIYRSHTSHHTRERDSTERKFDRLPSSSSSSSSSLQKKGFKYLTRLTKGLRVWIFDYAKNRNISYNNNEKTYIRL